MNKENTPAFIIISNSNIKEISAKLKEGKGSVLLVKPEYASSPPDILMGKFSLFLYSAAIIDPMRRFIIAKKNSKGKDREYFLRPKPQPDADSAWNNARDLFQNLKIGKKYQFEISAQCVMCIGPIIGQDRKAIFIPRQQSMEPALFFGLTWMTGLLNTQIKKNKGMIKSPFTKKHVMSMISYALEDLRTGAVIRHNRQAGREADALVGIN